MFIIMAMFTRMTMNIFITTAMIMEVTPIRRLRKSHGVVCSHLVYQEA